MIQEQCIQNVRDNTYIIAQLQPITGWAGVDTYIRDGIRRISFFLSFPNSEVDNFEAAVAINNFMNTISGSGISLREELGRG
jgi:hypothetical protein